MRGTQKLGVKYNSVTWKLGGATFTMVKVVIVEEYGAPHDRAISLKMILPIGIAEHQVRGAVLTMFIRAMEEPAEVRTDIQYIEVIPADQVEPCACRIAIGAESDAGDGVCDDPVEAAGAIA